ncbi:MAG: hypothetical protein IIX15_01540 [Clostridia bacterium]|nr:hypothetical protein [Clostridia bacterium]
MFFPILAAVPSVWQEMWQFLSDKYFSVNFEEYNYEHITLSSNKFFSAQSIIIALFLGVIIAAALSLFQKRTLGDLVRALDRENCTTPESAKTLAELGLLRNSAVRQDLRSGTSLRRVVRCVGEEHYRAEQEEKRKIFEAEQMAKQNKRERGKWKEIPYKYDFSTDRFYIPERLIFGATTQFDKKGTNPLTFALTVIVCIVLMILCCRMLPEMLQLADNFISVFKKG